MSEVMSKSAKMALILAMAGSLGHVIGRRPDDRTIYTSTTSDPNGGLPSRERESRQARRARERAARKKRRKS